MPKDRKKRVCIACNAKLAFGNTGDKCRPCSSKDSAEAFERGGHSIESIRRGLLMMGTERRAIRLGNGGDDDES